MPLAAGYTIRKARKEDCAALPAIELAAAEMFRPLNILPNLDEPGALPLDFLEQQCAKGLVWVATFEEKAVGFLVAMTKATNEGNDFYVAELDVHPDHGKRGLGAGLMHAACDHAFETGEPRITLCTFRDVPWNAPFYAKLGFTEIAKSSWLPWMHDLADLQTRKGLDMETRCYMALLRS